MPQPKLDRCLLCRWSDFGDMKQKDEVTKEPIGKCCREAPAVVVVHFQESALELPGRAANEARPGAIHEIVTGSQPIVKASFWCRHWLAQDKKSYTYEEIAEQFLHVVKSTFPGKIS